MGLSADCTMFALVVSFVDDGIWAIQSRRELILVEEEDVRFWTRTLVLLVVDELDFLEFGCHGVWICGYGF